MTTSPAVQQLSVESIFVGYGGPIVVRDVTMEVEHREFVTILGPSGSGKTTLLRAIAGYLRPATGIVAIAGTIASNERTWLPPERRRIGIVTQEGALFPHLDVAGNIAFGLRDKKKARVRVAEMLEMVDLSGLEKARPHELSGGQQQRVALARALAPGPSLVLLDEPFSSLDASLRFDVRTQVRRLLADIGTTAILVTHDQEEALSMADRVAVMSAGRIEQMDAPWTVYDDPTTLNPAVEGQAAAAAHARAAARLRLPNVPLVHQWRRPGHRAGRLHVRHLQRLARLRCHSEWRYVGRRWTHRIPTPHQRRHRLPRR